MEQPTDLATERRMNRPRRQCVKGTAGFLRDEDGSLIIFSLFMFILMATISGLAVDLMRFETTRTKLQSTVDRAALAAASLNQSLDPNDVVDDYLTKAGMGEFLDAVQVQEGFNYRQVTVNTEFHMPTHFFNTIGIETLTGPANSIAQEAIGNVEISMVLDVSGSMGSYNRLVNLKSAAEDFIDTVYAASEDGTVATSIIPYATQVNAGPELLSHYNLGDEAHSRSHCVNFDSRDFESTTLSTTVELQQTVHFDPWYKTKPPTMPVCPDTPERQVLPWSQDPVELKEHVLGLTSSGNTSTDIGLKWGAVLLDPTSAPVLSSMVSNGDVDIALDGRPLSYRHDDTMKIIVVMTDGQNTSQYYMKDEYRSGETKYWLDPSTNRISIWNGQGPEPLESDGWELSSDWYYMPHSRDWDNKPSGGSNAVRMTWPEVWARASVNYHADREIYPMYGDRSQRNTIRGADRSISGTNKNTRMAEICAAAKDAGIIIFAVGLEISDTSAERMENCASSPSHFFRVEGLDIGYAFQAIASQINQLRLVQ